MKYIKKFENQKDYDLVDAINADDVKTVKKFIKYSFIDIDYQSGTRGDTPLLFATYKHNIEIIKLLIDAGADVNKPNDNDWTPLLVASNEFGPDIELCKIFVNAGANLDTKCNIGDYKFYKFYKFDHLSKGHQKFLIENFQELCKEHLLRKEADKYNL